MFVSTRFLKFSLEREAQRNRTHTICNFYDKRIFI